MEFKIENEEIRELMNIQGAEFPKYATQIINLASQNAQATRPKVVGKMSELIKEFTGKTLEDWEIFYTKKYPQGIEDATQKILEMIKNFKNVINEINEDMVKQWVKDLVIVKTFIGLKFQEAIIKKVALEFKKQYRLATPEEESKGIDGYIGDIPISIKPITYKTKSQLSENIKVDIIFYKKEKDGIKIIIQEDLEKKLRQ
ncbi:MjaI family restriction endonuclease [Sulfurihydrogenibium azorense]|uniref:MjaI family restriction endonuclease n=2 Tax=Sulfurihydrogenibium azorense TaxID=309806 RepID=UPI00391982A6